MRPNTNAEDKLRTAIWREDEEIYRARCENRLPARQRQYRLIDLFCGAGGMSLGFSKRMGQPFEPIWANDMDRDCLQTYNANFGKHCLAGDINEILQSGGGEIGHADVVIGGPPCQGFSLLNKNRQNDPRKQLWRPFLEVVRISKADVFVMENVPQLLGTFEHGEIVGAAESLGFNIWFGKLCAADYGVPQVRWRAFIVGCRFQDPRRFFPPRKTHSDTKGFKARPALAAGGEDFLPHIHRWRNVRDAIGDLPAPKGTDIRNEPPPLDLQFGRSPTPLSVARYKAIPSEGMNRFDLLRRAPELTPDCWIRKKSGGTDLFGRLWWDRPSFTIRTEFFKPEKGRYLHPNQHRPITHREAARLQSFPDDFVFLGSKIQIAKQIGNAVPPLLAARVADIVRCMLARR